MKERAAPTPVPRGGRRLAAVLLLVGLCLACDQAAKQVAIHRLAGEPPISVLGDAVRLSYTENPGSFLGLGKGWPSLPRTLLLTGAVGALIAAALGYALLGSRLSRLELVGLSLLVGGGLGNLLDRALRGGIVVDFLSVRAGPVRTGVFNVADLLIEAGVLLLLAAWARSGRAARDGAPETES